MELIEKNRAFKEQISEELDQKSEYARKMNSNHEKDLALEKEKNEALQMQNSRLKEELSEKAREVEAKQSEVKAIQSEVESKNEEIDSLKEELDQLQKDSESQV